MSETPVDPATPEDEQQRVEGYDPNLSTPDRFDDNQDEDPHMQARGEDVGETRPEE